jgi:hypothetical protein
MCPYMVYIHGGGFAQGSDVLTVFGDRHVREQDVVLVGVNHRINVFGYTYLGGLSDKYTVGNPGVRDTDLAHYRTGSAHRRACFAMPNGAHSGSLEVHTRPALNVTDISSRA